MGVKTVKTTLKCCFYCEMRLRYTKTVKKTQNGGRMTFQPRKICQKYKMTVKMLNATKMEFFGIK